MYGYIKDHAPYLMELMRDKKQHHEFDELISKVCTAYMLSNILLGLL